MRFALCAILCSSALLAADYREFVVADAPAAYWRFDDSQDCCAGEAGGDKALAADLGKNVSLLTEGPRPPVFPGFEPNNVAADFTQAPQAYLRVKDPGAKSVLDFTNGEIITIESWVQCRGPLKEWQFVYIVGKGRTAGGNNQNWGLRLLGDGKLARASFIFSGSTTGRFHRWNSNLGFAPGDDWHHIAVTYEFGKPDSIRAWIDGRASVGVWDDGGATADAPVVDDDEMWIGSSMRGQASSTFPGSIDEVAIYRRALEEARIRIHATRTVVPVLVDGGPKSDASKAPASKKPERPPAPVPAIAPGDLPNDKVRVDILEFPTTSGEDSSEFWTAEDSAKNTATDPTWDDLPPNKTERWNEPGWLLAALPNKYNEHGVKIERSRPFLVRMVGAVTLPPGEHKLLLRALTGTRIAWDGTLLANTPLKKANKQDNDPIPDQLEQQLDKTMPPLPPGHVERAVTVSSDGKPHVLVVESWIGGKNVRPEIGELCVWHEGAPMCMRAGESTGVSPDKELARRKPVAVPEIGTQLEKEAYVSAFLSYRKAEELERGGDVEGALKAYRDAAKLLEKAEAGWPTWHLVDPNPIHRRSVTLKEIERAIERLKKGKIVAGGAEKSANNPSTLAHDGGYKELLAVQKARIAELDARHRRIPAEDAYWKMRHDLARANAKPAPELPKITGPKSGDLNPIDSLIAAKLGNDKPAALVDDASFLRRVTLDTIGLIPTAMEAAAFLADKSPEKRTRAIDRLLADPRWADHWTSYWQDVLAENPNIIKGTLNNTGPFRWWIHESLLDNKPMDRFATELIAMEGSANYGGPAGFGIATQNDLPMAAKAQVIAGAFLANEMKCARCHDAVHHSFEQRELFQLAAMLGRAPLKVPETSLTKGLSKNSHVKVTLKAGESIEPHMPFGAVKEPLPGVLRRSGDTRELLAALLTDPRNERFPQVIVNRLWKQFMGFGIVEPVDDWETSQPSHPELLRWLAHELVTHDYDVKHVARLILSSAAYQRSVTPDASREVLSSERTFSSQARRRFTAEQLLDSLLLASGQQFDTEMITFDPEARQNAKDQGNFGVPRRAWEFASLSNERDRPALAKPKAQIFTDVLVAFGWRESRPDPRSTRDREANIIQPALLANGTFGALITRAHDDNALTALALRKQPVTELARSLYLTLLSREPSASEIQRFVAFLTPGYDSRLTGADRAPRPAPNSKAVSWASHLNPDATTAVIAAEREVKAGPAPTPRLTTDWRDRYEDALWTLLLSPEFVWVP